MGEGQGEGWLGRCVARACPRINFVGSLCRKLCRISEEKRSVSTKFARKAADKEPKIVVLGQALARMFHRPVRGLFIQSKQSSVRSAMSIEPMIEKVPSSVGAACRSVSISVWPMPLLRSLGFPRAGHFYKHAAPNGAIAPGLDCEICGLSCAKLG